MRPFILACLLLTASATTAGAATPSPFTPEQRVAILCSERIAVMQDGIVSELTGATGARKAAMNADYAALARISDAFDSKHPTYPSTPEGQQMIQAANALVANDAEAQAAYLRWDAGDMMPIIRLMRRCEVMSGVKALRPDFGTW